MHLLMIGVGYFPRRTAGDKNFFLDLAAGLRRRFEAVTVLSINDLAEPESCQETPAGPVRILNVRRPFHCGDRERFFHHAAGTWSYHHLHRPPQEILERHLTVLSLRRRVRRLVAEGEIDVVHFMDNFGLAMPWLRRWLPCTAVTATALRFDPRGWPYRFYLRRSFAELDGVGCMTDAYRAILIRLGLDAERVATLRWGAGAGLGSIDAARCDAVSAHFGLAADERLLVWAGFIQQIAADSLKATVELSRRLVARLPRLRVVLAFKPESWREEFRALGGERIHVERGVPDFPALLARADFLVSPVIKMTASVAPPLTWLEAMALGTPVATTRALGVEEAVVDGETGIVADQVAALEEPLAGALRDAPCLERLARGAREMAMRRFAVETITGRYARFFADAQERRRNGRS